MHGQRLARAGGARTEDEAPRLHRGERRAEADGSSAHPAKARYRAGGRASSDAGRPARARPPDGMRQSTGGACLRPACSAWASGTRTRPSLDLERAEGHIIRQHAPPAAHHLSVSLRVVGAERAEIQRIRQSDRAAHVAGNRGGRGKSALLHCLRVVRVALRRARPAGRQGAQRVRAGEMKAPRRAARSPSGASAAGARGCASASAVHAFCRATISRAIIRPQMVLPSQISPRMTISNASSSGRRTRPRNSSSSGCVSP